MYTLSQFKSFYFSIQRDLNQKMLKSPSPFFLDSISIDMEGSEENIVEISSFLCLFFDNYPFISRIHNSQDKKKIGMISGARVVLKSKSEQELFLLRFKYEFSTFLNNNSVMKDSFFHNKSLSNFCVFFNPYYLIEFGPLALKFQDLDLPPLRFTFHFSKDCAEKNLLIFSSWLNGN